MAENVQEVLDRMVPALNDLQERGIFSKEEIHAIVDRRRVSEYAMRRRQPRKADFLRYLQQEMDLEKLRKLRVKRQTREQKSAGKESKKSRRKNPDHDRSQHIGDRHIVAHLHYIWGQTIKKFKSDVAIYLQYASFCKEVHAHRALSRVFGEALRLHPNNVDLWIEAASNEFFEAGSVQNARVLFQRALRIHPKQDNLWLQFFALELHFASKMIGRRKILQPDHSESEPSKNEHDPFAIASLVFDNAVAKFPENVHLRARFWDQCRQFPHTGTLKRKIWDSVVGQCGENEEAWLALAVFSWKPVEHESTEKTNDVTEEGNHSSSDGGFLKQEFSVPIENEGPSAKKLKTDDGSLSFDECGDAMMPLKILKTAIQKFPTEEMFLKTIKTVNRYIDDMHNHAGATQSVEAAITFLGDLLAQAAKESFYSAQLAVEHATFLTRCGQKEDAKDCLSGFVQSAKSTVGADLWVQLAELSDGEEAIEVLERGTKHIDISKMEHFHISIRLLAAKILWDSSNILPLFERLLLLAPGFKEAFLLDEESFGVTGFADVCSKLVRFLHESEGPEVAQNIVRCILYKSTVAESMFLADEDSCIDFFSTAIETAKSVADGKKLLHSLKRLYDRIIEVVGQSALADDYRQQKQEDLASSSVSAKKPSIPKMNARQPAFDVAGLQENFEKYRVVHLTNVPQETHKNILKWKIIDSLFAKLTSDDRETWCVETDNGPSGMSISPSSFLIPKQTNHRAYCSFLVQKDQEVYKKTESILPVARLPGVEWSYESAIWFFFGRNPPGSDALPGRKEHTDSLTPDGTWHFQLAGRKTWQIRPTKELLRHMSEFCPNDVQKWNSCSRIEINCRPGDILIINTRLWFHQTVIPAQPSPSVSYARDFWCRASAKTDGEMSNVDGLYATGDIDEGTIIFTEEDMPECSLHRSSDPNCALVEIEDGGQAIVSIRNIINGEFFCVANSDDEASAGDDEEDA